MNSKRRKSMAFCFDSPKQQKPSPSIETGFVLMKFFQSQGSLVGIAKSRESAEIHLMKFAEAILQKDGLKDVELDTRNPLRLVIKGQYRSAEKFLWYLTAEEVKILPD